MEQVQGSAGYVGDFTLSQDQKTAASGGSFPSANLPIVPASIQSANRSGLPLAPLGAAH
jgi:hypothetical protein